MSNPDPLPLAESSKRIVIEDPNLAEAERNVKELKDLMPSFRRPFANLEGGKEVGWTLTFPERQERQFALSKEAWWSNEHIWVCAYFVVALGSTHFIRLFNGYLNDTPASVAIANYTIIAFFAEVYFIFLLLIIRFSSGLQIQKLSHYLAGTIVISAIMNRITAKGSSTVFLLVVVIFGFMDSLPLIPAFLFSSVMAAACILLDIVCVIYRGGSGVASGVTSLEILALVIFLAFGTGFGYMLRFFERYGYLKTLAIINDERTIAREAKKSDDLLRSILPDKVIQALKAKFGKKNSTR